MPVSRELVDDAIRTMLALNSVRIDCTFAVSDASRQQSVSGSYTLVLAGEDYHQSGDLERGGDVVEHVRAILGEPREYLFYRGVEYVRDPRYGDWLRQLPDNDRFLAATVMHHTIEADTGDETFSREELDRRYLLFGNEPSMMDRYRVTGAELIDGVSLAHLVGEHSRKHNVERMLNPEDFAASLLDVTPETIENYRKFLADAPDSFRGRLDIWIDETTHLIHRLEWLNEARRDDRIVHSRRDSRVYADFNTASLPGSLPE